MLSLTITFLVIALVAWVLGLPSVSLLSAKIAKMLFLIFIILFLISLIFGAGIFAPAVVAPVPVPAV